MSTPTAVISVLDALIEHLRAKDVVLDGLERPAVILWTDPKAEWRPVIEMTQTRLEELLVLGDYQPTHGLVRLSGSAASSMDRLTSQPYRKTVPPSSTCPALRARISGLGRIVPKSFVRSWS